MSSMSDPNSLPRAVPPSGFPIRSVSPRPVSKADGRGPFTPRNQPFNGYTGPAPNWPHDQSTLLQRLTNIMDGEVRNISPRAVNGSHSSSRLPDHNQSINGSNQLTGSPTGLEPYNLPSARPLHESRRQEYPSPNLNDERALHNSVLPYDSSRSMSGAIPHSQNMPPQIRQVHSTNRGNDQQLPSSQQNHAFSNQSEDNANSSGNSINNRLITDLRQIEYIVKHQKTILHHLDAMLKQLGLSRSGIKKVKLQRILEHAHSLFRNQAAEKLSLMRLIVDENRPKEILGGVRVLEDGTITQVSNLENAGALYGHQVPTSILPLPISNSVTTAGTRITKSLPRNPLGPLVLTFVPSPFYKLNTPIGEPVIFMKPHMKRKLAKTLDFKINKNVLDSNSVFLACQEFFRGGFTEQPMYFPFYMEMELDGRQITANTRGVRGIPGSAKPVDLSDFLKATETSHPGRKHVLKIILTISDQGDKMTDKSFAFSLNYGFKLSMDNLIQQILARPHISKEETTRLVASNAVSNDSNEDDGIISSEAVYSLKDKVMMTRIEIPIRSKACFHIDCFDAKTFIMLQNQAETWKCPVCNQVVTWESLAVDEFFSDILAKAGPEVDTVSIKPDGTWQVDAIDEDMNSDDSESGDEWARKMNSKNTDGTNKAKVELEVVELLSDSDDDSGFAQNSNFPASRAVNGPSTVQPMRSHNNGDEQNTRESLEKPQEQQGSHEPVEPTYASNLAQHEPSKVQKSLMASEVTPKTSSLPTTTQNTNNSESNSIPTAHFDGSLQSDTSTQNINDQELLERSWDEQRQNAQLQKSPHGNIIMHASQDESNKNSVGPQNDLRNALRAFKKSPNALFGFSLRPNSPSPPHEFNKTELRSPQSHTSKNLVDSESVARNSEPTDLHVGVQASQNNILQRQLTHSSQYIHRNQQQVRADEDAENNVEEDIIDLTSDP